MKYNNNLSTLAVLSAAAVSVYAAPAPPKSTSLLAQNPPDMTKQSCVSTPDTELQCSKFRILTHPSYDFPKMKNLITYKEVESANACQTMCTAWNKKSENPNNKCFGFSYTPWTAESVKVGKDKNRCLKKTFTGCGSKAIDESYTKDIPYLVLSGQVRCDTTGGEASSTSVPPPTSTTPAAQTTTVPPATPTTPPTEEDKRKDEIRNENPNIPPEILGILVPSSPSWPQNCEPAIFLTADQLQCTDYNFINHQYIDWPGNDYPPAVSGTRFGATYSDITTFDACKSRCTQWVKDGKGKCYGVAYVPDTSESRAKGNWNTCWLKTSFMNCGREARDSTTEVKYRVDSAQAVCF